MRQGTTIVELTVVLGLLTLLGLAALPATRKQVDRAALIGAREAMAALVVRSRREAVRSGGARLLLSARDARAWVEVGDSVRVAVPLGSEFGVEMELVGGATRAALSFDALGLGRAASRTIVLRRGGEQVAVVVAAHGRVVRR